MSLVCIFDRGYEIAKKKDIQLKLAELIYLPHIHNVFVDTDSTKQANIIGAESASSNTKLQIYARHIHPNVLTDKQDALKQYLVSEELKDTIKVYVAPTKDTMNKLLERTTGTGGFDHKNTVYILCNPQSLMNLISVLQTMEFKRGDYLSEVTTYKIHPILEQILAQSNELNVKVQTQIGGSDGTSSEKEPLLEPKSEIEPAPLLEHKSEIEPAPFVQAGTNRFQNVAENQEPHVLQTGTTRTKTTRKIAKDTSKQRKIQKSIVTIMGKSAGNTPIRGNALGTPKVTLFDALSHDDAIYIIAPDESDLDTSNIFKSLVKFFMVKPNSSVRAKDIEKGKTKLPAKLEPKELSGEVGKHGDDAIIKMGAKKAKQALPQAKQNVKEITKLLDTVKSEFETAKKEFMKDPENMRVYKEYILPHIKSGKGLILNELLTKLNKIDTSGIDIEDVRDMTNEIIRNKLNDLIAQYKYECVDERNAFECITKSAGKKYSETSATLDKTVKIFTKTYKFAIILKYINMHNFYNSRILHVMDMLSVSQVVKQDFQRIKTMKARTSSLVPVQKGQIVTDSNRHQTLKAKATKRIIEKVGVPGVNKTAAYTKLDKLETQKAEKYLKEFNKPLERKEGIKHAFKWLVNKEYRAARKESDELKKQIAPRKKAFNFI